MMTNKLIESIKPVYDSQLGFSPRRAEIVVMNSGEWKDFCAVRNLDVSASGLFLPRSLTAVVNGQAEFPELAMFHEYFGHGLFCEYAQDGRRLTQAEGRLLKAERQEFEGRFSSEQLAEFRRANPLAVALEHQKEKMLGKYEAFAVWTEWYLANLTGRTEQFNRKYKGNPGEEFEATREFQRKHGDIALFYEMGMPRYPTPERVKALMDGMFGSKVDDIKLAVVYGSRRAYSDIDLLVVSEAEFRFFNGWLDIRPFNQRQFEYGLSMFDMPIHDALTKGEFAFGDEDYFKQMQQRARTQPVTEEAIWYNLIRAKEIKNLSGLLTKPEEQQKSQSYSSNYARNALLLRGIKNGRRI